MRARSLALGENIEAFVNIDDDDESMDGGTSGTQQQQQDEGKKVTTTTRRQRPQRPYANQVCVWFNIIY
jgi:hypothetical protein